MKIYTIKTKNVSTNHDHRGGEDVTKTKMTVSFVNIKNKKINNITGTKAISKRILLDHSRNWIYHILLPRLAKYITGSMKLF